MAQITLNPRRSAGTISKYIYGHFAEHLGRCIYGGIFVGKDSPIPNENGIRKDVAAAMRAIRLPVLRWPGGCFADEYHWQDGIGPQENRKRMVNTNWGGVVEDNSFGTHEFMELCRQVGCEPYINGNVGSGTIREMSEWIEYVNSEGDSSVVRERWKNGRKDPWNLKFFAVGNENWGCGGNMRAEFYADQYRRYQCFCRQYGQNKLYKIACGPNDTDTNWTEVMMKNAAFCMDGLSMHSYTVIGPDWEHKGSATQFSDAEYYTSLAYAADMDRKVTLHCNIMDRYDPQKRIGLIVDEWGNWFDVEPGTNPGFLYQQNTMRDAMTASVILNIFNRHCDRIYMANIAQTVNVLQSIILTEGEKMVLTPTYYVFDLYKEHMDAKEIDCFVDAASIGDEKHSVPSVTASASEKDGKITLTVTNLNNVASEQITLRIPGQAVSSVEGRVLSGDVSAYNDFDNAPLSVQSFNDFTVDGENVTFTLARCSVAEIRLA